MKYKTSDICYADVEKVYYQTFDKASDSPIFPKGKAHKKNWIHGYITALIHYKIINYGKID